MKLRILVASLFLILTAWPSMAGDPDYLARMAEESEIQAIAVVTKVQNMGSYSDGTLKRATFKRVYAVTPDTPKTFVGGCKTLESRWQKRAEGTVYFKLKPGQRVFVTVSTDGGAITSLTPLSADLDYVIREEPNRLIYSRGRAAILPKS
ncbi:hypothetical protein [Pseudodesulfovibrio portus]|uniref:Uncharacterized protein n=1 Tax=Pseudodesulfovibrio portus TaxID=231439 RepID=A0ABN6RTC5_9BACT|nr:hypothetical protein [Pseudodesulfovibrio portus]BDQ34365.1 hypothetical protein JCM14722_19070 [Pseudodesulfovibrio portus]